MKTKNLILALVLLAVALVVYRVHSSSRSQPPRQNIRLESGGAGAPAAPPFGRPAKLDGCRVNGSLPDPECTPGDIIASETREVICDPNFRTSRVRNSVTTPAEKARVYQMYNIPHPRQNRGPDQVCEIDHLVPLELGGNDTIANLWPQCTPGYAGWPGAGFHDKDGFENYLRRQVCAGRISLAEAQRQIATDWYGYWVAAGMPRD
jgi:hypothetical protein